MEKEFVYLKNPIALKEINKHRWIESEKIGRDIGFLIAAVDWINKYGELWRKTQDTEYRDSNFIVERRQLRRFNKDIRVLIINKDGLLITKAINLSLFGLLCKAPGGFTLGSKARLHLSFISEGESSFTCIGMAYRITRDVQPERYEVFFKFDDDEMSKILKTGFLKAGGPTLI